MIMTLNFIKTAQSQAQIATAEKILGDWQPDLIQVVTMAHHNPERILDTMEDCGYLYSHKEIDDDDC